MKTKVARWGNSLALRLPKSLSSELGFCEDSLVEFEVCEGTLVVKHVARALTLEELVAGITPENLHAEVEWGQALGAEFA